MTIDLHAHCFPDELAPKAMAYLIEEAGGIKTYTEGTVSALKRSMDAAGIDVSVLQPVATKPGQVKSINDWQGQVIDDRVKAFGALHPDLGEAERKEAIRQLLDQGVKGAKFHPDYQRFYVDEERALPMYEDLFAAGLCVLFHAGIDFGLGPPVHCPPDRLALLLDRFPEAQIIAAHMGGFYCWDGVEYLLEGRNILLDTSYALPYLGAERAAGMIRRHGPEKILFGTDVPWAGQADGVRDVKSLGLPAEAEEAILGGNARRLLGL
jgi:predicted TIM-barrel fold metal-dependent hydrolase